MERRKELRPRDLVIDGAAPYENRKLRFDVILQSPADTFWKWETGEGPAAHPYTGIYDLSNAQIRLENPPIPLFPAEENLLRLAVTVHLWRRYHLLPEDFYLYCTVDSWMSRAHFEDRSVVDNAYRNAIEGLGYYYPYQSNGPKKHAGYRNAAVRDLIDTEENYLESPDRSLPEGPMAPGKERCRGLREIRRIFAEVNGIPFVQTPCRHVGRCLGHCPVCEAEIRYLNAALQKKKEQGSTVYQSGLTLFFTEFSG